MKESSWVKIIFALLGIFIIFSYLKGYYDLFYQLLFVVIFAGAVVIILYNIRRNFIKLKHWAMHHNFNYHPGFSRSLRLERFAENKNKSFFKSRSVQGNFDTAPAIEGIFNGRQFWFFGLVGVYPFNKMIGPTDYKFGDFSMAQPLLASQKKINDRRQKFTGWCMEFKTYRIPISMIVRRNYLGGKDELNTESVNFEKLYHVDIYEGHGTLQLLDPMMIQLITDSGVAAFEFSDNSVVLYFTLYNPNQDQLDKMLEVGLKIAEQVDRNFPMSKYEK